MSVECTICYEPFDLDKKEPTLLTCGHTLCKACTSNIRKCPLDKIPFDRSKLVKNFMLIDLMDQMLAKSQAIASAERKCEKHGEAVNMYCADHVEELCSECLFQAHKGDQVQSYYHYTTLLESLRSKVSAQEGYLDKNNGPSEERKRDLKQSINDHRQLVADHIERRFQDAMAVIHAYRAEVLKEVDDIFAMNQMIIANVIASGTQSLNDQLPDLIGQASKSMSGFGKLTTKQLNKEIIARIIDAESLTAEIEAVRNEILSKELNIDLPSVTKAIYENTLDAFDAYFSPIEDCLEEIFCAPSLYSYISFNSQSRDSNKVIVTDPSLALTREDLSVLANSCSFFAEFEIADIDNSPGANTFSVSFRPQRDALSLALLSGACSNNRSLSFTLVDEEASTSRLLKTLALKPSASEKSCVDKNFASMLSEFETRLEAEIVSGYRRALVSKQDEGLQSAIFLARILNCVAVCLNKTRKGLGP